MVRQLVLSSSRGPFHQHAGRVEASSTNKNGAKVEAHPTGICRESESVSRIINSSNLLQPSRKRCRKAMLQDEPLSFRLSRTASKGLWHSPTNMGTEGCYCNRKSLNSNAEYNMEGIRNGKTRKYSDVCAMNQYLISYCWKLGKLLVAFYVQHLLCPQLYLY